MRSAPRAIVRTRPMVTRAREHHLNEPPAARRGAGRRGRSEAQWPRPPTAARATTDQTGRHASAPVRCDVRPTRRRTAAITEQSHGVRSRGWRPRGVLLDRVQDPSLRQPIDNERASALLEVVRALVDAKRCLASGWQILDGTDGAAAGVEPALNAALASIDAISAIEHVNAYTRSSRPRSTCKSSGRSTASVRASRPAPDPTSRRSGLAGCRRDRR